MKWSIKEEVVEVFHPITVTITLTSVKETETFMEAIEGYYERLWDDLNDKLIQYET